MIKFVLFFPFDGDDCDCDDGDDVDYLVLL